MDFIILRHSFLDGLSVGTGAFFRNEGEPCLRAMYKQYWPASNENLLSIMMSI